MHLAMAMMHIRLLHLLQQIQKYRQISPGDGDPKLGDDSLVAVLGPSTQGVGQNVGLRVVLGKGNKKRNKT
ncbi:hypothetical protein L6452_02183 [Arctium lappa]|uniref:Uncharacterized protein n=1 Tax=Arctium lappa TaxID=4217 RepID=A0ACB9FJM0_ARCLA|nr:hypothetical protein L6452_02183 [Arctium lappa]